MRSRLLAALALFTVATAGLAIEQPPEPDSELQISFEVRAVSLHAETPLAGCPTKTGAVAFLTDAQLKETLEAVQRDRRANVMQAPKVTALEGQEVVLKVTEQRFFTTGLEAVHVNGSAVLVPKNTMSELGVTLKLLGKAAADKKSITANINFTDTRIEGKVELLPVTTMITPIFEGGAQGTPVPFTQYLEAPRLATVKIDKADLRILSGGHAIIAGPEFTREMHEELAVSYLAKQPVVGRMYRKASVSKVPMRTLLIVSARVVEPMN